MKLLTLLYLCTYMLHSAELSETKKLLSCGIQTDVFIIKPNCGDQGDCLMESCNSICGCDKLLYYNSTLDECLFDYEGFRKLTNEHHDVEDKTDAHSFTESKMARRIQEDASRRFNGIMISVMLFITCCCVVALSACIYCCRIEYTDRKLRNDVEALAEKLNRDGKLVKPKKTRLSPVAESCNIVVEDAGVFVV